MKRVRVFVGWVVASAMLPLAAQGQDAFIYPQKGQSVEQQSKDKAECTQWATGQTGFSPAAAPAPAAEPAPTGGAVRGAARGAVAGAAVGAIAGDAGKGAAIGATAGGMGGAMRKRDNHMVCVPVDKNIQVVRSFGNYTIDLHTICDWLSQNQIKTVAMESTGVYWIPLFEELEQRGVHCCLISSRSLRRIPGRKTDVLDCQWIQTLHSYGLLEQSFRPSGDLVALRTLLRHRAQLIEHRAPHILHMQKALLQMNIQLSQVLSDITGETGLCVIRAIVAGERDPHKLAAMRGRTFVY